MTLREIRSMLAPAVDNGVCVDDPRIIDRANEAQLELLAAGHWVGTLDEYVVCPAGQCFTLPPGIETAVEVSPCGASLTDTSGGFYSRLNQDVYLNPDAWVDDALVDRGEVCTFYDICDAATIQVHPDLAVDAGATVRIEGSMNGDPTYVDQALGETLVIPAGGGGLDGTGVYTKISKLSKTPTKGYVRIYAKPVGSGDPYLIARLEPNETTARYRRYYYPALVVPEDGPAFLRVTGVKRWRPMLGFDDDLMIPNPRAIKLMILAIIAEERIRDGALERAKDLRQQAITLLENEVKRHLLDPQQAMIRKARFLEDLKLAPNTMGHVRARLAVEVTGAMMLGISQITRMLQEAQEKLLVAGKFSDSIREIDLSVDDDGMVILPAEYDSLLTFGADGSPLDIESGTYEYLPEGPGSLSVPCHSTCRRKLVDKGWSEDRLRQYQLYPLDAAPPTVLRGIAKRHCPMLSDPEGSLIFSFYPAVKVMFESIFMKKQEKFDTAAIFRKEAISMMEEHTRHTRGGAITRQRLNRPLSPGGWGNHRRL